MLTKLKLWAKRMWQGDGEDDGLTFEQRVRELDEEVDELEKKPEYTHPERKQ